MLTRELLAYRTQKGILRPAFVKRDDPTLAKRGAPC
ncbi:DUF790 family protein [Myxococcus sp. K38C18041901]|nr:DUF790 family protein [Myxococcus guangdongensis]MCP3063842.1 DUF790 family protein [Myxococcus guangdongensis]